MPRATRRYLIEPKVFINRYLPFIEKIKISEKKPLRNLLELSMKDLRTITGMNLRWIMLLTGKGTVEELKPADTDKIEYHKIPEEESWRIDFVQELIDIKYGDLVANSMMKPELDHILNYICCS